MINAEVKETNNINSTPKIHESVRNKTCFVDGKNTLSLYLTHIDEEIGTVNLCEECWRTAEAQRIKSKYGGNPREALKANAIEAGKKTQKALGKLWNFGKDLLK